MDSDFETPRIQDSENLHASEMENGSTKTVILWVVVCVMVIVIIVLLGLYS